MDEKKNKIREKIFGNNPTIARRSLRNKSNKSKEDFPAPKKLLLKKQKVNAYETKLNNIKLKTCKVKLRRLKLTEYNQPNTEQKNPKHLFSSNRKREKFYISRGAKEISTGKNLKPSKNLPHKNDKSNNDDIYEFLSQTSCSQSNDEDPNKDIIEKLVTEGKASLIKHMVKNKKKKITKRKGKIRSKTYAFKKNIPLKPKSTITEENVPQFNKPNSEHQPDVLNDKIDSFLLKEYKENEQNKSRVQKPKLNKGFLEMVKKIVESTPVGKKVLSDRNSPNISPIVLGDKSPWRLPERLNFSRTPQISNNISFSCINKSTQNKENTLVENIRNARFTKRNQKSCKSKLNNENFSPQNGIFEKNDSFFKDPNPRVYRSPLKQINIMEVISLPQQIESKENENSIPQSSSVKDISIFNEISKNNKNFKEKVDYLFGFEEYLTEDESNIEYSHNYSSNLPSKRDLKRKLKRLRYALPKNSVGLNLIELKKSSEKHHLGWEKQTDIRELLSSSKNKSIEINNFSNSNSANSAITDLFKDTLQGETTFDFSEKRRTYLKNLRGKKEKNNIISYDSESHDEMEDDECKRKNIKKKTENKKRETKKNEELESFAAEFNSMCEEVDKFELLIE